MKMKTAYESEIAEREMRNFEDHEFQLFSLAVDVTAMADNGALDNRFKGFDTNTWEKDKDKLNPYSIRRIRSKIALNL
jgi:hypothetical protein